MPSSPPPPRGRDAVRAHSQRPYRTPYSESEESTEGERHMRVAHPLLERRPVGWWRTSDGRWCLPASRMAQTLPVSARPKMRWLRLVVLMLGIGGACLMLYGNAQNITGDGGERATITGTVVVIVVEMLVVSAVTGECRSRGPARGVAVQAWKGNSPRPSRSVRA